MKSSQTGNASAKVKRVKVSKAVLHEVEMICSIIGLFDVYEYEDKGVVIDKFVNTMLKLRLM